MRETEKKIGKIISARFGLGGYDDAMIGISFSLGNDSWGVQDFWGQWADNSEHIICNKAAAMSLTALFKDAKKGTLDELAGIPVEVTFDGPGGKLLTWRVLTEVI